MSQMELQRAYNAALPQPDHVVVLVEHDAAVAEDLARQLGHFGYRSHIVACIDLLSEQLAQFEAAVVIMDIVGPGDELVDAEFIASLQHTPEKPFPILFTSKRNDLVARLQAVRAGGYAYLAKPIDVAGLVDILDRLTKRELVDPYRVLIVDDSRFLAHFHAAILEREGMQTAVITRPLELFEELATFQPDLILMDMYMPGCTGQELAAIIRQQPAFVSVPIVFLSSETNRDVQLWVMRDGIDGFLTKPIAANHLISIAQQRAQRARELRNRMIQDGLTGLLNHTAVEARLEVELAHAQRANAPLAVAVIDIDQFKQVNDTYGHIAGDRVLKSLAHMLQHRLRKSDSIGRYGGEEFVIVLPQTDAAMAHLLLNDLRIHFAHIRHRLHMKEWHVTFSCGIACASAEMSAKHLVALADIALYAAKRNGRNRIEVFDNGVA